MTFDDDFLRLPTAILASLGFAGKQDVFCRALDIDWPPPERLNIAGVALVRISISEITDEQRAGMTHVCRGAEYHQEQIGGEKNEQQTH